MSKKKLIISVLCMALLFVMPVQAANECRHPVWVDCNETYHDYETTTDQHREYIQDVIKRCKTCGEDMILGAKEYLGGWEGHDWELSNPQNGNTGQTVYDAVCKDCGKTDTVTTYP